ncbi:MAG: DUF3788 family protein [Bacteroidota bacterium]
MENPLLNDPDVFPTAEVLEKVIGKIYPVFREFMNTAESEDFKLDPEWRYYKDGKAWLCKISFKKKTVAWLSVWSDCFKVAFYFTEKSGGGIPGLKINDSIKEDYLNHEPIGKLKPLIVETRMKSQLSDISTLLKYKIGKTIWSS